MLPTRWYRAYFFDVDGTVVRGHKIIPGVNECLEELRAHKSVIRFISNSSSGGRAQHVDRMQAAGIEVYPEEVVTTIEATVDWLAFSYPEAVVFPVGTPELKQCLEQKRIRVSEDPSQIDIVLAASDHELDFTKLQISFDAIHTNRRAFLIATNADRHSPRPHGTAKPDAGTTIAAIEGCTGTRCQMVIGKPNPHMLLATLKSLDIPPEDTLMTGDTIATDIGAAHRAGTDSAITLTGDTDRQDLAGVSAKWRPTWVVSNLTELIPA